MHSILIRLVSLLVIIQLINQSFHVNAAFYPSDLFPIAVIGDFADERSIKLPLQLALNDIKQLNILPSNQAINLTYLQTINQIQSTRQFLDNFYARYQTNDQFLGVISAINDETVTLNLGQLGSSTFVTIPVIAPLLSSSASSGGGDQYRYLVRTFYSDRELAKSSYRVLKQYSWEIVAIVYSDDVYGRGFMESMLTETSANPNISLTTFAIPASTSAGGSIPLTSSSTTQALQLLLESGVRVIVLHSSDAKIVIETASLLGMIGHEPYTWIGDSSWCNRDMIGYVPKQALLGSVCVSPTPQPDNEKWQQFTQRLYQLDPSYYEEPVHVPVAAGFFYDSLMAIARAIATQSSYSAATNTGASLLSCLLRTTFEGVTGPFRFPAMACSNFPVSCTTGTAGLNDRSSNFNLINYDQVSEQFNHVGSFATNINGTYELIVPDESLLTWSDGSSEALLDRPDVYTYGKQVKTNVDARIMILAYAIAAFGAWCSNILLEQAVSSKQQWHNSRSQPLTAKTGAFVVTRATWLAWTAAAALALSTCTVWSVSYLDLFSVEVHTVTTYISSVPFAISVVYDWVMIYIALIMMLQTIRSKDNKNGIESSLADSSESRSGTVVTTTENLLDQPRSSVSSTTERRRRRVLEGSARYKLHRMMRTISYWNVLSAIIVAVTVVTQQLIAINSLEGGFSFEQSSANTVAATFFVLLLIGVPLLFMFHLFNSRYRILAPFLFAAIAFGGDSIAGSSLKFYYKPGYRETAYHTFEVNFISDIAVAISSLILCFFLMALNIWYLRQTRKLIDKVINQVEQQIAKYQTQVNEEKAVLTQLEQQYQQDAKVLEAISFCRPHYRPYSTAFVLADHRVIDHEEAVQDKSMPVQSSLLSSTRKTEEQSAKSHETRDSTHSINTVVSSDQPLDLFSLVHVAKDETQLMANLRATDVKLRMSDIRLADMLQHPIGLAMLSDFASSRFTPENIYLFSLVEKYRAISDRHTRLAVACEIDRLFIREGAPHQVNIDSYMRHGLSESLKQEITTPTMFDAISQEIQRLISTNYWDTQNGWLSSVFVKQMCLLLQSLPSAQSSNILLLPTMSPRLTSSTFSRTKPRAATSQTRNSSTNGVNKPEDPLSPVFRPRSSINNSRVAPRPTPATPSAGIRPIQRKVSTFETNSLNTPQPRESVKAASPQRSTAAASTRSIVNRIAIDTELDQQEIESPVVRISPDF